MFFSFILWLLIGIATSYFANQRGRDPFTWFAIGMILGLFGMLLLVLLPVIDPDDKEDKEESPDTAVLLPPNPDEIQTNEYHSKEWYYIDKNKERQGPVTFETIQQLWKNKVLQESSFIWHDGMSEWKKLADLPEVVMLLDKN